MPRRRGRTVAVREVRITVLTRLLVTSSIWGAMSYELNTAKAIENRPEGHTT